MTDALDRVYKPFGKKERAEYAKQKAAEEEARDVQDRVKVNRSASLFEQTIRAQRKAAGLA